MPDPSARTVLVLGANGRFGLAAAKAFAAAGWHVLAHVRRDADAGMPAGAELVRAPLAALAEALLGRPAPSVVVHGINPIYTRWDEEALPAARAGDGPRRAPRRALHAAGQRLQLRRRDAGPARRGDAAAADDRPRAASAPRWSASSSGAPPPGGCARP